MSTTLRFASFCVATALFAACGRDPVERKLVGTWEAAVASPTGAYELRFTAQSNGLYRTDTPGAASVSPEIGIFKATSGHWRLERSAGGVDEGTYQFVSDDSVLLKSKTGVVLWTRVANGVGAGVAATPGPLSSGTGAPSAALLATGPFGPAVEETAAASFAPGEAASGAPAAAGFAPAGGAPASAGFAPTVLPRSSPNATAQSLNEPAAANALPTMTTKQAITNAKVTVHQTASQTVATAKAGAQQVTSQAATSATDAVNDAAAETNKKVGQKIGAFAGNAGSKIKNFFTGGKAHNDDSGSTDGSAQKNEH
jgi:hypothetical protein